MRDASEQGIVIGIQQKEIREDVGKQGGGYEEIERGPVLLTLSFAFFL